MKITVTQAENGMTIKKYLESQGYSARLITRLKAKDMGITVNGEHKTVRWVLKTDDILGLEIEDSRPSENIIQSHVPVRVLFEDEHYIAVPPPEASASAAEIRSDSYKYCSPAPVPAPDT